MLKKNLFILALIYLGLYCEVPGYSKSATGNTALLAVSQQDSVSLLLKQASVIIKTNAKDAFNKGLRAWEISSENKWDEKKARSCIVLGNIKIETEDFYQSKKYYTDALSYFINSDNADVLGDLYFKLGLTNYYLSSYDDANSDYLTAIGFFKKNNDQLSVGKALQNIGLIYHNLDQLEKAENYYTEALEISKQYGNDTNIAALYQNLGIIYYRNKNYENALDYYERSFNIYNNLQDTQNIAVTFSNIGLIQLEKQEFEKAFESFNKSNDYFEQVGYKMGRMWAYHNMGNAKVSAGDYDNGFTYFNLSLAIAEDLNYLEGIMSNKEMLSDLSVKTHQFDKALVYYKEYTAIHDSIHSSELKGKIAQLEALYKVETNEKELSKSVQDLKYQKIQKLVILIILGIVIITTLIIYQAYRQKKNVELQLSTNKISLENAILEKNRELENQISERRIAEESDKLKSAFLANMSHELRTPMNAIIAFSHFLRDNSLADEKRHEYLDHITSAGDSLLHLIDDIIDIAKLEAKQLKIFISPTNTSRVLRELNRVFIELKSKNSLNVDLALKLDQNFDYIINTDSLRIKQILTNLLENAFKYTEKGLIEFGFNLDENALIFYVSDTGIGIPKDKHLKIFERFSQLEYALDRKFGGTGLGLAISKNLAELLGGKLWVESTPGNGSTFFLSVPTNNLRTVPATFDNSTASSFKPKSYYWDEKIILVAEDEELNFKVLESCISKTKAKILRARNGEMAIKLCLDHKIDLVLMDIQMPGIDGYRATAEIKKFNKNIPIIAQTSFAMSNEKEKCMLAGCDEYISKPLDLEKLLRIMDTLLQVNINSN